MSVQGQTTFKNYCIMVPVRRNEQNWLPDIFNDFFVNRWMERANCTAPAINVIENEKEYDVELAAPGLTKEDFKIQLDNEGNLVINMEKKNDKEDKKHHGRFLRREFSYEKFQQTLMLPEDADIEKIDAAMEHGVLNVHIPKIEKVAKPEINKLIEIK